MIPAPRAWLWLGALLATAVIPQAALATSADSLARPITLREAVEMAQVNSPQVIAARGEERVTAAAVRSAWGSFIPSVSVSAGANRRVPSGGSRTQIVDGQVVTLPDEPWSYNIGYSANVELFSGGSRIFDLRRARARREAASYNIISQRYSATLEVKQQFFNVLAARESEGAALSALEQADQQLRAAVSRVRARVATRSDSLRAEIQRSNARLALLDARNSLDVASAALTRAVGAPEPVTAAPSDTLEEPGVTLDAAALSALAEEGPAVREARANLTAARQAAHTAWTAYVPSLNVGYSRGGNGTSPDFTLSTDGYSYSGSVRLSLSFPLFNQFQREGQIVQAQVAQANAEAALRDARLAALETLAQSLGGYNSATERVATQTATVRAAEEDLRVQQQRYAVGNSTLLDLLTSQAQLVQARRDLIRARYDRRISRAQLEALIGQDL